MPLFLFYLFIFFFLIHIYPYASRSFVYLLYTCAFIRIDLCACVYIYKIISFFFSLSHTPVYAMIICIICNSLASFVRTSVYANIELPELQSIKFYLERQGSRYYPFFISDIKKLLRHNLWNENQNFHIEIKTRYRFSRIVYREISFVLCLIPCVCVCVWFFFYYLPVSRVRW